MYTLSIYMNINVFNYLQFELVLTINCFKNELIFLNNKHFINNFK